MFGPEDSILAPFLIFYSANILLNIVRRVFAFYTTTLYFDPREARLLVVSRPTSLELPLKDLKGFRLENAPDILKLHPLFVHFIAFHEDFTVNFNKVMRLNFYAALLLLLYRLGAPEWLTAAAASKLPGHVLEGNIAREAVHV